MFLSPVYIRICICTCISTAIFLFFFFYLSDVWGTDIGKSSREKAGMPSLMEACRGDDEEEGEVACVMSPPQ